MQPLDVLVIAAHPDDAEIGAGGTISLLLSQGKRVGVLDLTDGEPTPFGSPEVRAREAAEASRALGLTWRGCLGLPNRRLEATLEARAELASVLRELRPEVLLAHYWEDSHPDHVAASALTDAARFWAKLSKSSLRGEPFHPRKVLYYFSIHLRDQPRPSLVVDISGHLEVKMRALRCYHSQLVQGRAEAFPTVLDDIQGRARYWGWAIGKPYGEPFVSREVIGLGGLDGLV
jgi:bacillithiol biosynthesis deacetylase BshB1